MSSGFNGNVLVHGEEGSDNAMRFSVRVIALVEDGERSESWVTAEGSHTTH